MHHAHSRITPTSHTPSPQVVERRKEARACLEDVKTCVFQVQQVMEKRNMQPAGERTGTVRLSANCFAYAGMAEQLTKDQRAYFDKLFSTPNAPDPMRAWTIPPPVRALPPVVAAAIAQQQAQQAAQQQGPPRGPPPPGAGQPGAPPVPQRPAPGAVPQGAPMRGPPGAPPGQRAPPPAPMGAPMVVRRPPPPPGGR